MAKTQKKYNTNTEEEQARKINEQFKFSKLYLDNIHERMNSQEELYRSYIDKNKYPHQARVFDPRIFRVIETITPRMVSNEPTGSFYPTETGDIATTHILSALNKYDWRKADMFPKLVTFVKSMLIFGTAFGRTYWDYRVTEKKRMKPLYANGRMMWTPSNNEMVQVTEADHPNFEPLNIYDCFPDPNSTSIHNMRWFIYRTFKTIDELENENTTRGQEYYKNLDKLKEAIGDSENNSTYNTNHPDNMQYREHRRVMLSTEDLTGRDPSNPEITVLRRFTKEGWCDIVPEYGNIVIREVDNPYFHGELPIIHGVDYPYPGELYGMGEIEPIDRIQRAINAVLNQRLDNVQLNLKNMWKVKKGAGVDMHTLVSAPGNIILTSDMSAVEPITIPDVTGGTFVQTMNYLTSALQNGSGITDYTIGVNSGANTANKTATGTRLIQQEANAQFKLKIQLFNHMVIQKIANQWKDLRIQYTTENQKLRIIGQDLVKYLKEKTDLAKTGLDGQTVLPGDLETPTKLELTGDDNFAFLNLFPEDIQPAIVGDYDFIATVSSEQLIDPVALQENFFTAIEKVTNPAWTQGLAQGNKALNYEILTQKVFEKLQLGLEVEDVVKDIQSMNAPSPSSQIATPEMFDMALSPQENQNPFPSIEDMQEANGQ